MTMLERLLVLAKFEGIQVKTVNCPQHLGFFYIEGKEIFIHEEADSELSAVILAHELGHFYNPVPITSLDSLGLRLGWGPGPKMKEAEILAWATAHELYKACDPSEEQMAFFSTEMSNALKTYGVPSV